jgi:hypothetical protein
MTDHAADQVRFGEWAGDDDVEGGIAESGRALREVLAVHLREVKDMTREQQFRFVFHDMGR